MSPAQVHTCGQRAELKQTEPVTGLWAEPHVLMRKQRRYSAEQFSELLRVRNARFSVCEAKGFCNRWSITFTPRQGDQG